MIKNEALINEELDPKLIINRLKKEVEDLKNQLAISNNGSQDMSIELKVDEMDKLRMLVQRYLDDRDADSTLNVGADMRKINFCFKLFKELYIQATKTPPAKSSSSSSPGANLVTIMDASHYDSKEMKDLKDTLKQRDNEISKNSNI